MPVLILGHTPAKYTSLLIENGITQAVTGLSEAEAFSAAALAEPAIAFTPANPKVGEYVDVVVTPGREGAQSVAYTLETEDGVVFSGEADTHFTASFRPRTEKAHLLKVTVSC